MCVSVGVRVATITTCITRSCAPYIRAILASVSTSVFSFSFSTKLWRFQSLRLCASAPLHICAFEPLHRCAFAPLFCSRLSALLYWFCSASRLWFCSACRHWFCCTTRLGVSCTTCASCLHSSLLFIHSSSETSIVSIFFLRKDIELCMTIITLHLLKLLNNLTLWNSLFFITYVLFQ